MDVDGFIEVITTAEAAKNDFNLSPSRYIVQNDGATEKTLTTALADYAAVSNEEEALSNEISRVLKQLKALAGRTKTSIP
jgi:type I restriction enzyme M protein